MRWRVVICCLAIIVAGCSLDRSGLGGTGDASGRDGGTGGSDGGGDDGAVECTPAVETCNGADDDCDGSTDEDFDLQGDLENCGSCDNACASDPVNAAATCAAGSCGIACDAGFGNCDGDDATGCEAAFTDPASCGSCSNACASVTPLCQDDGGGFSCVASCASGTVLCGMSCVDTSSDPSHCGGCGNACPPGVNASSVCTGGSCGFACDPGFDDCDGATTAGCEQSLSDVAHCGACDAACAPARATGACVAMMCQIGVCDAGRGDCNTDPSDGCERRLTHVNHCGACGVRCTVANGSATCGTGSCAVDTCDPGFGDCNSDPTDGCETDTTTDLAHCGGCGMTCATTCSMGGCISVGPETTCDGMDDNMNGQIDEGSVCPCPVMNRMGSAYMFCAMPTSWPDAETACRMLGYELVTIDNAGENTWVTMNAYATSSADRWWIGYNDRMTEGTFVWSDPMATSTYENWTGSEPTNSGIFGEDCVEIDPAGGWVDTECRFSGDTNFYVCEAS